MLNRRSRPPKRTVFCCPKRGLVSHVASRLKSLPIRGVLAYVVITQLPARSDSLRLAEAAFPAFRVARMMTFAVGREEKKRKERIRGLTSRCIPDRLRSALETSPSQIVERRPSGGFTSPSLTVDRRRCVEFTRWTRLLRDERGTWGVWGLAVAILCCLVRTE